MVGRASNITRNPPCLLVFYPPLRVVHFELDSTPPSNNSKVANDHGDDTFDVASRLVELEQLDPTKELWKDIYGRTGIKKGYIGLFLEKELSHAYQQLVTSTTDAEFNQHAVEFQSVLSNAQAASKHSFEATYYASPDVAVLSNGFVDESADLLLKKLQEPVREIKEDFNANALANQPVLFIPSGGLMGMEKSTFFKSALDEYVKTGGTLIVLAQQNGSDFSVVPTPDGRPLAAYGWTEDQSCFWNGTYVDTYHQMMSAISTASVSAGVDGYFTSYPENSTILLRRTVSGQPAMLMYEHGRGRVIVSSFYSDWGAAHAQVTKEEIAIVRDMISWVKKPVQLPEIRVGEAVTVSVAVTNSTATDTASVKLQIYNPDRTTLLSEQTVSLPVPAGQSAETAVAYQTAAGSQLGIYHIDYLLLDAQGNVIQPQAETDSGRFVVKNPPTQTISKPLTFKVNAPTERFIYGSNVTFTWHVWNNTATERTVTIKYGFPHHTWVTGNQDYGNFYDRAKTLTVPANGEATFNLTMNVLTEDQLFSKLYDENNNLIGQSNFKIWCIYPSISVGLQTDKLLYAKNETVSLTLNLQNKQSLASTATLRLRVMDPSNLNVYSNTLDVTLAANGASTQTLSFALPATAQGGSYSVLAEAYDAAANKIGGNSATFEIPLSQISVSPTLPAVLTPGANTISFNLANIGKMAVNSSVLDVNLTGPDGVVVSTISNSFALDVAQSRTLDVSVSIPPLKFGTYALSYSLSDENSRGKGVILSLANNIAINASYDKPSYRQRETLAFTLKLSNPGKFSLENALVTVTVPDLGYQDAKSVTLIAGGNAELPYSITIPDTVRVGEHAVNVRLSLPSGSELSYNTSFKIPESELKIQELQNNRINAGDTVNISLVNVGGDDTSADYTVELYDSQFMKLAAVTGNANVLAGSTVLLGLPVPQGAVSGAYLLSVTYTNRKSGKQQKYMKEVALAGIDILLTLNTDKDYYLASDVVKGISTLSVNGAPITNGTLKVRLLTTTPEQAMMNLPWWNTSWGYRSVLSLNTNSYERENGRVEVPVNLTEEFTKMGSVKTFDENSLRVIEYGLDGNVIGEVPSQFDKGTGYNAATNASGKVVWIMDGVTPAGSTKRYAIYFDAVENGSKPAGNYPLVIAVLNNTSKTWKTDGVYLKWGGYAYNGYVADAITELRFDDNNNNNPADDFNRLQSSYAFEAGWYGFMGDDFMRGLGGTTGTISAQGPVFTELSLGSAKIRYYRNNRNWIETNSTVDYIFNFGAMYDFVKTGITPEHYLLTGKGWTGYYGSSVQPKFMGYRVSSNNVIFGTIATNVTSFQCVNNEYPGYDKVISFSYNATSNPRFFWYSDKTGNYDKITKTAEGLINSVTITKYGTQPATTNTSGVAIWEKSIPVTITGQGVNLIETQFQGLPLGKFYVQSMLYTELQQPVAQGVYPFYVINGTVKLTYNTDKRIYKPGEMVVISGAVENQAATSLTGLSLTIQQQYTGGSRNVYTNTINVPSNGRSDFSFSIPADVYGMNLLSGKIAQNGTTLADISDQFEVAPLQVTATLTAPDLVGNDPFAVVVELKNSGKTDAAVNLATSFTALAESVSIPAGQTKLLQHNQQIAADTSYTFTFSGDLNQTFTKTVRYGLADTVTVVAQPSYAEGKLAIPVTISNTGLLDGQFSITYQLSQGTTQVNQQTRSYFLPKGGNTADTLSYDFTEGGYQLSAAGQLPTAAASTTFQVRKENRVDLALSTGGQTSETLPVTTTLTNFGYNNIEGSVQLSLTDNTGNAIWTSAQEVTLLSAQTPAPTTVAFSLNLSALAPGNYTLTAKLLNTGNQQLAAQSMPIAVQGPTFQITQTPPYLTINPGQPATFTFRIKNTGNQEGAFELAFKAEDLIDSKRTEWLKPNEEKELAFTFATPTDLEEKDYLAGYTLKNQKSGTTEQGTVKYRLAGINLGVTAALDKQSYAAGETAQLTLTVQQNGSPGAVNLFARVNYNGYEDKQSLTLNGNQTLTFNVPLTQITGEKLFYGIYHEAGRSIHLNTIYIYKTDDIITVTTDKQLYNPGETVALSVSGSASGSLNLTGPGGFNDTLDFTGSATRSFVLPATMTAGTYTVSYALTDATGVTTNGSHPFDVAGIQVKVKEATLDKAKYVSQDTLNLSLNIESNQNLPATLKTWVVDPAGVYTVAGSDDITLTSAEPLLVNRNASLVTASSGIHRLVYGVYQGDLLLVSGSEAFDVGEAVLLGLATDKVDYALNSVPVAVKAELYGSAAATLELFVDGTSVQSTPLNLTGFSSHTFTLAPEGLAPGLHKLRVVLTAGGLTSTKETSFVYGSNLPDLTARLSADGVKGSNLTFTAVITNQGKTAVGQSSLTLYDGNPAQGGALITTLSVPPLEPGQATTLTHTWNVLGKAGNHLIYAVADSSNAVLEFNEQNNTATYPVSLPNLSINVTAGKPSYKANEEVGAAVALANLAGNVTYANTTLKVELVNPSGTATLLAEKAVAVLYPATENSTVVSWNTTSNPPGIYTVRARFMNAAEELAANSLTFAIEPTPSLAGSLSLDKPEVIQGFPLTLAYTLTNNGNIDLPAGVVTAEFIGRTTAVTSATSTQSFAALAVLNNLSQLLAIEKVEMPAGDYSVKLTSAVSGLSFLIGERPLKVLPPLEVSKGLSISPRVLVFLGCGDCEQNELQGGLCHHESDRQTSLSEAFLNQTLAGMGVYYHIAHTTKSFKEALRTGLYNSYVLAGNKPLSGSLDEELAERVNSGDGLILLNYDKLGDAKFRELAGAKGEGHLADSQRTLTLLESPITQPGLLATSGTVQKLQLISDHALVGATVEEKGKSSPALVINRYGEGDVILFSFDVQAPLLQKAIEYGTPDRVDAIAGTPLPMGITLKSVGAPFDLRVTETTEPVLSVLFANPTATLEQQRIVWQFNLRKNETRNLHYLARLPEESGSYLLNTEVSYLRNGRYEAYRTYSLTAEVEKGLAALKDGILTGLQALSVTSKDAIKLDQIRRSYELHMSRTLVTDSDADKAIDELLKLTEDVRGIPADTTAIRLDLDRLIRVYERKWVDLEKQ